MSGTTKIASGIIPIAADTKRICLAWRSPEVNEGNRFGIIGGMVKDGMSVEEGALAELGEEVGYYGQIQLHPAYVHRKKHFEYHSYIGIVPIEFSYQPEPEYAWETSFMQWMPYVQIVGMMEKYPQHYHKGLIKLFHESKNLIERFV